ncbi:hypothetical protein K8I61_10920 [bacterium]|nr:hypothetical protein [bacterium]
MMRACVIVMGLLAFAAPGLADTKLAVSPEFPLEHEGATVTLSGEIPDGLELRVTYRPNSVTQRTVAAGLFVDGRATFIAEKPGITLVEAAPAGADAKAVASANVAVRFARFPISGALIFLFAGAVLFGGSIYAVRLVMKEENFAAGASGKVLADE